MSDSDIVLKLAACDLIDEALTSLGVASQDVYVTSVAQFSLRSQAKRSGPQAADRVEAFLKAVRVIDWEPPAAEIRLFEDTHGIDMGEAVLYAATARGGDFILATGDKVSLRALVRCPECDHIVRRLIGRVVCLEQIIQRCIACCGFELIRDKVVPACDCDQALRAVFGLGMTASADGVKDGLESYIRHLRSQSGELLSLS